MDRQEIEAALEGATEGPWFVHDFTTPDINPLPRSRDVTISCAHPDHITVAEMAGGLMGQNGIDQSRQDARLIAMAPALAREVLRLMDVVEAIRASVEDADERAEHDIDNSGSGWVGMPLGHWLEVVKAARGSEG